MQYLEIETQLSSNGSGSLETHPSLNPDQWDVVHGLGIQGIECICEVESGKDTSTAFTFSHTSEEGLRVKAQQLAFGLEGAGVSVSFNQHTGITAPVSVRTRSLVRRMITATHLV